jgi:hypothetical protein
VLDCRVYPVLPFQTRFSTTFQMTFHRLAVACQDLNLALVLKCGQSFRWRVSGANEWQVAIELS